MLFVAELVQAASSILKGVAQGSYNIKTPDFFCNLLISGTMASLTPRMFPLAIEILLAPLAVIGATVFRYLIDREVWKVRHASWLGLHGSLRKYTKTRQMTHCQYPCGWKGCMAHKESLGHDACIVPHQSLWAPLAFYYQQSYSTLARMPLARVAFWSDHDCSC